MKFLKVNKLSFLSLLAMIVITTILYPGLPETIPVNYDWNGVARSETPAEIVALLIPVIYAVVILLIEVFLRISPEKYSMPNSRRAKDIIVFGVGLLLTSVHIGLLTNAGDMHVIERFLAFGMALFLIVVGNVFGKMELNFIIGIRLPWTIAPESNWRATHRFAGRLMVIVGVALFIVSFYYSHLVVTVAASTSTVLIPVIYSYLYFNKNERSAL